MCWKSRLSNYKSHIKNKISICKIVKHFINGCPYPEVINLRFIIVDLVNNGEMLDKIDIGFVTKERKILDRDTGHPTSRS